MNFVILDLEWNGAYSRRLKGFMNEIIQFGAVKTDENLNILDTFDMFIRPQVGKKISGKIKTLTNISNEELSGGCQFMQAVSRFKKWMGDAVLMTWGTSDILTLIENCRYFCGDGHIPFLTRYIDLQAYCEQVMKYDKTKQMGLSAAAELLQIDMDGIDHHRALDDSLLSLRCLQKIYSPRQLKAMIQDTTDERFYDKIQFKTIILCDLHHPLVRRSHFVFRCNECGRRAQRTSEWQLRNKSYRANFVCRHCGNQFTARVQFKLKYEELVVKKCILPFQPPVKKAENRQQEAVETE